MLQWWNMVFVEQPVAYVPFFSSDPACQQTDWTWSVHPTLCVKYEPRPATDKLDGNELLLGVGSREQHNTCSSFQAEPEANT